MIQFANSYFYHESAYTKNFKMENAKIFRRGELNIKNIRFAF